MNDRQEIPDNDIARLTLDIWEEAGLLATTPHSTGTFYHSARFPAAPEFNFFMPSFGSGPIEPDTLKDIAAFYGRRNGQPVVYCPDPLVPELGAGEAKFREVMMRADVDEVLVRLDGKTARENLSFARMSAFSSPDYLRVYNSVFMSPDSHSQYDDIYKTFIEVFGRAAKGGLSYEPWLVLGRLDGEPATAATVVAKGKLAGLYNLATKPEFRGKNLAALTMRDAFRQAKERGAETLFLITETDSDLERTYARMGFRPFARYSAVALNPAPGN
jgi:GNAT superfamily N-acetyltransferase